MDSQQARLHTKTDALQRAPEEGCVAELAVRAVLDTHLMDKKVVVKVRIRIQLPEETKR
jgi:hypothetical protein